MAAKPLTSEAIALTEKKMDMALDDIIKMSKKSNTNVKQQRVSNKSQRFSNAGSNQGNASKMRCFMDSRSSMRQGVLAQRRSNFQANQFPMTTEAAKKAAAAPIRPRALGRNRMVNWNKPRIGAAAPAQRRVAEGGFAGRKQQQQPPQAKVVPKQRPQTLDSLFANMKEQRMRTLSQQMNVRRTGGSQQHQRRRGQFNNYSN
ncbi:uncharacterized protein LOC122059631 [Macadamia integrifolia]|uniref:uncharacterized protein LOC122059631 n=1 Tax=Macadamia integrifolia TaxID=60698 RepID=UPI001C52A855|nr:uncharacterized protein LOC122059631 [Macadamia integrifolia]XP_042478480.1 uncharacterized protein LOC122059631 [Macadamia integrifolia]